MKPEHSTIKPASTRGVELRLVRSLFPVPSFVLMFVLVMAFSSLDIGLGPYHSCHPALCRVS